MTHVIAQTAMLASLHISQWSARRYDKGASSELNMSKHARDVARVNKLLVSKSSLAQVQQIASLIRTEFYRRTLPWGDNGDRILPAMDYQAWTDWYEAKRSEWESAVDHFVEVDYKNEVRDAAYRMGDLFNINDYPRPGEVRDKFSIAFHVKPVPTEDDFRVSLTDETREVLRKQVRADIERATGQAVAHLWEQIGDMLESIRDRLSDPDARFKRGLLDNFVRMVDDLDKLNIANDPELTRLRQAAESAVLQMRDPEALRKDKSARSAAADEVKGLVDQFAGMWS